uniref:Uncharacterized protein n=1 Tax=Athene cunicularia TaxID=194338 RepID=A0A663MV53_ATHCN
MENYDVSVIYLFQVITVNFLDLHLSVRKTVILKLNPFTPPVGLNYPLFPHQDDGPLVDPCSGFMSPGVGADLQRNVGRPIESLVEYSDVPSHRKEGPKTSQDRRWKTRAVSAAFSKLGWYLLFRIF